MSLASIRVRLPLTYAAVSLVAALALCGALILALRDYYTRRELAYLSGNARVIAAVVAELTADAEGGRGLRVLEEQMSALSFVSRARVRVLDVQHNVLADSGSPTARSVLGLNTQRDQVFVLRGSDLANLPSAVRPGPLPGPRMVITAVQRSLPEPAGAELGGHRTLSVTTDATLYDFETDFIVDSDGRRSAQRAIEPIVHFDGRRFGYVELSESPAYGSDVVNAVLRGWALASAAAVGLASLAGWWISRRISGPLLRLTDAAARMAAGDLQARARVGDGGLAGAEIGGLARTFDDMSDRVEGTISALRAFVSDAAHEINTPLMALQNQLELAESTSGHASAMHINHARQQAARLAALSHSLLDLSRLEAAARSSLEAVELGAAVREVCEAAASRADSGGIRLDVRMAETPAWITGAPQLVHQALSNVLDNALKFTPEGGEVRVLLDELDARARVQVLDTGIGIPDDEVHAVFDRFRRARNASAYAGNGLGLAIVRAIVELQGGAVTAGNRDPGPGVCVTLIWPIHTGNRQIAPAHRTRRAISAG